jgi:hypothetical protein
MPAKTPKAICLTVETLNLEELKENLVYTGPHTIKYKNGMQTVQSIPKYLVNGTPTDLYIAFPKVTNFGVSEMFKFGYEKKEGQAPDLDKLEGYQTCILLTSQETVKTPTEIEQKMMQVLDILREKAIEHCTAEYENARALKQEGNGDEVVIPDISFNAMNTEHSIHQKIDNAMKPIYSYPQTEVEGKNGKKKKTDDLSKPPRLYCKLLSTGKGREVKIQTKIYGPGDRLTPAKKFLGQRVECEAVLKPEKIYWGSHGSSPYGMSVQLRLFEANMTPIQSSHIYEGRFIRPNESKIVEEDGSEEESDEEEGGDDADLFQIGNGVTGEVEGAPETTTEDLAEASTDEPAAETATKPKRPTPRKKKTFA